MSSFLSYFRRWTETAWTPELYARFRALFGLYLATHFGMLVAWAPEIFGPAGALPDASASPLSFFPNVLAIGGPGVSTAVMLAATVASVLFMLGKWDRWMALGLWYVWAAALTRNPLIANPGIPFVGWLLLMHAALPRTDEGRANFTPAFFGAAWILMAAGYTYGGISKLHSLSWQDGTALLYVWESPLARDTFLREWLVALPKPLIQLATWGSLGLELFALPIALSRRLRPYLWAALTAMQLGILATVAFADLTFGMLMIHVVTLPVGAWALRGQSVQTAPERERSGARSYRS